jgi:penicillin-binding protein 1A
MKSKLGAFNKRRSSFHWKRWVILTGLAAGAGVCLVYGIWAQTFDIKEVEKMRERSAVFDMDGKLYSRFQGENRVVVPLDKVSDKFVQALLAREDTRFYKHHGIDFIGIVRAVARNILRGKLREGGSTITQQLARNSFELGGRNLHRKLLEAAVAMRIERNYSKRQILEMYVNRIYFGSGYFGVDTASEAYFGKPPGKLGLGESAMLVGLIRSPNRFSPFNNPKGAYAQRDDVLHRMADLEMITRAQADAAVQAKVAIAKKKPVTQENYAMDTVRNDLDVILSDDQITEGGLKIYTTIDPALQKAAESALDQQLTKIEQRSGYSHPKKSQFTAEQREENAPTPYLQGALVAIDNRTGGIRALVGGRDHRESTYNRALFARRQCGSTFKPFVYAAAFGRGLAPDAEIDDGPIRPGELRAVSNWNPGNSDGTYRGFLPAADGLVLSRNTMSVRVGDLAGVNEVTRIAKSAGLGDVPNTPSIFLGAFDTTVKDLTAAYTIFPNEGVRRQPYIIERIDDADGNVLYRAARASARAMRPDVSGTVSSVLEQVLTRGTAASARSLGWNKAAAGKTGTTNEFKDAWFVGYTKSLTCGVWVGLDHPATITKQGYGAALALPVWVQTMNAASAQRYPAAPLPAQQIASRTQPEQPKRESLPSSILQSFKKFFGGG